jgi:hypothetical protein
MSQNVNKVIVSSNKAPAFMIRDVYIPRLHIADISLLHIIGSRDVRWWHALPGVAPVRWTPGGFGKAGVIDVEDTTTVSSGIQTAEGWWN